MTGRGRNGYATQANCITRVSLLGVVRPAVHPLLVLFFGPVAKTFNHLVLLSGGVLPRVAMSQILCYQVSRKPVKWFRKGRSRQRFEFAHAIRQITNRVQQFFDHVVSGSERHFLWRLRGN